MQKRFIPLFLPYLSVGFLDLILRGRLNYKTVLAFLYGGRMIAGVYWFIPCLFLGCIGVLIIEKYINHNYKFFLYVALLVLAVLESNLLIPKNTFEFPLYLNFPLNMDVVLLVIVYVRLGILFRKKLENNDAFATKLFVIGFLIFGCVVAMDLLDWGSFSLDMKYSNYNNIVLIVLIPVCAYFILYCVAKWLERIPLIAKTLGEVGKNSMCIMYVHLMVRDFIIIPVFGEKYSIPLYVIITIGGSLAFRLVLDLAKRLIHSMRMKLSQV